MLSALLLAAGSALLGGALALLSRKRRGLLELTRTFAFAAAAGVVFFHLLPDVLPLLGASALLFIALGFALPWGLEALARTLGAKVLRGRGLSAQRLAAETGFAALFFHSVVEGLTLVAALRAPEHRLDLEIAIVAHHAPLTAAVTLPFLQLRGARSAFFRVLCLGAAAVSGVVLGQVVPGLAAGADAALLQRATAMTAGVLLHVVSDEIRVQRFGSRWERLGDLLASAAGFAVSALGGLFGLRDGPLAQPLFAFLRACAGLGLRAAPWLLCGALATTLLRRASWPRGWPAGEAPGRDTSGAGLESAAHSGVARGPGVARDPGLRSAFTALAALQLDALLLSYALLGWQAGVGWLCATLLVGPDEVRAFSSARAALLDRVRAHAPRTLALLACAGAVLALSPQVQDPLAAPGLALLFVAALLLAARLDLPGAPIVAAVLVAKGLPLSWALVALLVGPRARRSHAPRRAEAAAPRHLAIRWPLALLLAWVAGQFARAPRLGLPEPLAAPPFQAACALLLGALVLAAVWSAGVRGFFLPLRHGGQEPAADGAACDPQREGLHAPEPGEAS